MQIAWKIADYITYFGSIFFLLATGWRDDMVTYLMFAVALALFAIWWWVIHPVAYPDDVR